MQVHIEASRPLAAAAVSTAAVSVSAGVEESDLPKVEIWDPSADKGSTTKAAQQATASSVTGHQAVVLLSLGIVAAIGVLLLFPELRRKGQSATRFRRNPESRFRHDVPEEEIGLVSAPGGYHRDEDDIL
ncbi:unnamed protein product [Symbiodinium pilosum]|uniref:Uncharacterized protein n=1 Tax=Symbiodinium pilosum TaxID=2952 RepID=A0A812IN97_SYMPI|nr:unnamed protein product [Symbiodinium pilosum]